MSLYLSLYQGMSSQIYSAGEGAGAGAVGGLVAGAVMLSLMMIINIETGNPPVAPQTMTGMLFFKDTMMATYTGIGLHFIASTLIGLIFGAVTSESRIRLTRMGNGIGLGMITGMIAFAVLFAPMMVTIYPKQMATIAEMMNPSISEQDIMKNIQASIPMIINNSILVHIIFGAVLGAVTTAILRKVSVYKCNQCRTMLTDEKRYRKHMKQHFVVHG